MYTAKKHVTIVLLACLLVFVILAASGCKKKSEPAAPETGTIGALESKAKEAIETAQENIVQTKCPVMDAPINKDLYTEYKGKKVYFCCPGCKGTFEKDPEKYLAKLPQFEK